MSLGHTVSLIGAHSLSCSKACVFNIGLQACKLHQEDCRQAQQPRIQLCTPCGGFDDQQRLGQNKECLILHWELHQRCPGSCNLTSASFSANRPSLCNWDFDVALTTMGSTDLHVSVMHVGQPMGSIELLQTPALLHFHPTWDSPRELLHVHMHTCPQSRSGPWVKLDSYGVMYNRSNCYCGTSAFGELAIDPWM